MSVLTKAREALSGRERRRTGVGSLDRALDGGWPPGAVVELEGDPAGLKGVMDGVVVVQTPDPAAAIRGASLLLAGGAVAALYLGGGKGSPARDKAVLEALGALEGAAKRGGGTLLLLRQGQAYEPPRNELVTSVRAEEARMRAEAAALAGRAPHGPTVTLRFLRGGPGKAGRSMRFYIGHTPEITARRRTGRVGPED